jgi:Putative addiction module component
MNGRIKKLSEEIRKLSPEEQADLMDELLVLTYGKPLPESDKVWAEEIDRRIDAVERGEVKTVDARGALRKYKKP